MTSGGPILPRMQARIKELEENNQYLLEMEASYIAENEVLREQITSWIADRDRWIARYEAAKKENAALQERIGKLQEALKAFVEHDPCLGASDCVFCGADDNVAHNEDCPWEKARQQLQKEGLLP